MVIQGSLAPFTTSIDADGLSSQGYEVWAAADLTAAYDIFAKQVPHAVLLDINLEGENGLDLVKWMWQKSEFAEIPVIAVTAHAMVTDQARIMRAGCRACLLKPVEFRVLREELKRWLQQEKTPQFLTHYQPRRQTHQPE